MRKLLVLLAISLPIGNSLAAVSATVDRNPVLQGEAVELQLIADSNSPGSPDFTPLDRDFNILRRSSGTQINSINGQTTRQRTWTLILAPRRLGTLTIPAIAVGQDRSQPIALDVVAPDPSAGQTSPAFIEFSADTTQPYVRQQVLLSVKLFISGQLASGGLSDPQADGAVIEQLGEQRESQAIRGQTRYRVFEREYVLFAEAAGTLTVTPPSFNGELRSGRSPRSLFNFGGLGDTRTVIANGDVIELQVQPPPGNAPPDQWLPATDVSLTQRLLPETLEPTVGTPFTREIVLGVSGQLHTQIAPLAVSDVPGAQVYTEPPERSTKGAPGGGVRGVQTQRWAVIPQAPGTLSLPAIAVRWWDVRSDQMRTASLPAIQLKVLPASNAARAEQPPAAAPTSESPTLAAGESEPAPPVQTTALRTTNGWWPALAAAAALGWLLTTLAWLGTRWVHNRPAKARRQSRRRALQSHQSALQSACKSGDPRAARTRLLDWAACRFDAPKLTRLSDLNALLQSNGANTELLRTCRKLTRNLDEAAYGATSSDDWRQIAALLPQIDAMKSARKSKENQALPPLYPA